MELPSGGIENTNITNTNLGFHVLVFVDSLHGDDVVFQLCGNPDKSCQVDDDLKEIDVKWV